MNKKYVLHPEDYAIGENEKLYADMAARGWLLEKRGIYLSRFRRGEPALCRYRLAFSSTNTFGEPASPEDQLALYQESGWRYVTGKVNLHVFSAPEGNDPQELYTDPRQQASTLKVLRRKYYFSWVSWVVLGATLPINLIIRLSMLGGIENYFGQLSAIVTIGWMLYTAAFLLYAFIMLWTIYTSTRGAIYTAKLSHRLKQGKALDHAPKSRSFCYHLVSGILLGCCAASIVLLIVQWSQHREYDMPPKADGPYLLLEALGWDGERVQSPYQNKTSSVEIRRSILAEQYHTHEYISAGGHDIWLTQDVYRFQNIALTKWLVPQLMVDGMTTSLSHADFEPVDAPGLDRAFKRDNDYIAVKENTVYYITYYAWGNTPDTNIDILAALAQIRR